MTCEEPLSSLTQLQLEGRWAPLQSEEFLLRWDAGVQLRVHLGNREQKSFHQLMSMPICCYRLTPENSEQPCLFPQRWVVSRSDKEDTSPAAIATVACAKRLIVTNKG